MTVFRVSVHLSFVCATKNGASAADIVSSCKLRDGRRTNAQKYFNKDSHYFDSSLPMQQCLLPSMRVYSPYRIPARIRYCELHVWYCGHYQLIAEVDNVHCFANRGVLIAFAGVEPGVNQSGK